MVTEFEYNGKRFFTENLQKKLKRLKTTEDKITIINVSDGKLNQKKVEVLEYETINWICIWNKLDNTIIQKHVNNLDVKPDIVKLLENNFWNDIDKTGIRNITYSNIENGNLILLDGYPKFPIIIGNDGLPELEIKYNW